MVPGDAQTLRCSEAAKEIRLDPVGTAGAFDQVLLVEWPHPWPREVSEIVDLASLVVTVDAAALRGHRCRIQLIAPAFAQSRSADVESRVVISYMLSPDDRSVGRLEVYCTSLDELVGAASKLVGSNHPAGMSAKPVGDLLICAHGTRDVCCGSRGTKLASELSRQMVDASIWRTSHLGGHRFAPTALLLPSGEMWAHLDVETAIGVLDQSANPMNLRAHVRGNCFVRSSWVQALDRELFIEHGWAWASMRRGSSFTLVDENVARVAIDFIDEAARPSTREGLVQRSERRGIPPCGVADGPVETVTEYAVMAWASAGSPSDADSA